MATVISPTSNVEASYEDMFKEITRKLYGEETGNGLHTLGTPVAQVATTGPTAAPEGEQRSFTNLQIDRSSEPTIEYAHNNTSNAAATSMAAASAAAATAAVIAAATTQNGTNVVIQQQPEGSVVVTTTTNAGANFKSEDHLSTAFGLAALMQNGFATTTGTTILSTQAINKVITTAAGSQQQQQHNLIGDQQQQGWSNEGTQQQDQQQQQQQQQQPAPTTQIVQWTTTPSGKLQSYSTTTAPPQAQPQQQITSKTKTNKSRNDHTSPPANNNADIIYNSPITTVNMAQQPQLQQQTPPNANTSTSSNTSSSGGSSSSSSRKKSQNNNNNGQPLVQKRYACAHCAYSTDRRDLYTRHENIHKDEKPFQCYSCLKQFNRADHVKKHFLRMHRDTPYDINKTRRHLTSSSGGGGHHHGGGRSNITITTTQANVNLEQAFLEQQRQPTSSSLSIAETIEAVATATDAPLPQMKQEKNDDGTLVTGQTANAKPKREKRFTCSYCPWSGADKWGLKRHLNTHTKPFVCLLCDYKAARSERLATHVLKVHNRRACNKCSYLGDTLEEYQQHLNEVHPTTPSNRSNNNNNNNTTTAPTTTTINLNNTTIATNNNSSNNLNVLRTIGNTLGNNNNQLNQFQNNNNFSINNVSTTTSHGNSVTIYTTTTTDNQGGNIPTGGPLQEIIVNPSSMVGWRLSANGSLIPPHDLLTGGLPNAAAQKRGSERLFQYLEADGSDPEDYARLLKMDAISRNTASVAQDFHKAGGVHELKLPANHQLLFNNKLPLKWTTKEAAALLQSLRNANNLSFVYQQQQQQLQQQRSKYASTNGFQQKNCNAGQRQRQHSLYDDENTPTSVSSSSPTSSSSDDISPLKGEQQTPQNLAFNITEQKKTISKAYCHKHYDLQETSSNSSINANDNFINAADNIKSFNGNNMQSHTDVTKHQHIYDENEENQEQLIRSSPASKHNSQYYSNNHKSIINAHKNNKSSARTINNNNFTNNYQHRLDLQHNKENNHNAGLLTQMEYQNFTKIGAQFQNYIKDIINKYYVAESPITSASMPTAAATAQQSQQRTVLQTSPKRKKILSETEEYIEYLRNKEDITLTITSKSHNNSSNSNGSGSGSGSCLTQKSTLALKRERDLASDSYKRVSPKKQMLATATNGSLSSTVHPPMATALTQHKANKKSITQLATLLPLLADAASKQQYLTAPLDFSKKPPATQNSINNSISLEPEHELKATIKQEPDSLILKQPQDPTELQTAPKAYANFSVNALLNSGSTNADKRSSRKQAQPKKIRTNPEVVVAMLRDKYLNRMVDHKLSCKDCVNSKRSYMLVFNYHTKSSLCLHRLWKHSKKLQKCKICGKQFKQKYNLQFHKRRKHRNVAK